ncbi:MAG: site-specific DNA-methyltransferase [Candidatus Poribacteria bacterium]|nr:site-specific DNA-methyltransferase [Candidatus Poribacteria bacterium]
MPKENFNEKLTVLLKTNPALLDDAGELIPAAVRDHAWRLDHNLIKLLLKNDEIKATFFDEVEGHWIFNHNTFINYITDKNFLANSYTRFRNKIGLNIEGKFLRERGEVSLVWPYKDCVLEGGQTKEAEKRKEIFFNEILAQDEINRMFDPKVLTNWKRHTAEGEQNVADIQRDENGIIRENLIIKGNNLIALHTLKQQFRGQVKLIYIDPPYNTGSDSFGYNDNFNHSSWLTFMRNRLEAAKELLTDDGVFFASCDDNEQAYLKVLMDEIFGNENFVTNFVVIRAEGGGLAKQVVKGHDYLLTYAKNIEKFEPLRKPKDIRGKIVEKDGKKYWIEEDWLRIEFGKYGTCYYEDIEKIKGKAKKDEIDKGIEDGQYILLNKGKNKTIVGRYRALDEDGSKFYSVLKHLNADGKNELKDLMGEDIFDFPKPTALLKEIILGTTFFKKDKNAIILDFHAGSGTTAHAVLELNKQDNGNRKFILVEQMDYVENVTVPRVEKVMKEQDTGDFIYCELMQYNQAYMDKIQSVQSSEALVALWRDIAENSFLNWYVNEDMPQEAVEDFIAINDVEKQKHLLAELLDKNQLYVNLAEIEDVDFAVSEADKALNRAFYGE